MPKSASQKNTENKVPKGRVFKGTVVSDKMKDTIVVKVDTFTKHPKYQKFLSQQKKFKAHDAGNTKKIGDVVEIRECRPISKDKHFTLVTEASN